MQAIFTNMKINTRYSFLWVPFIVLIVMIGVVYAYRPRSSAVTMGGLFNLTGYASFAGEDSKNGSYTESVALIMLRFFL